ncbi:hypothetical protein LJC74_07975, partial [Eubacteriales bacterium OttesenSCG-928-A19]|nr:hypothetical protein [Eubacteriales bacterium OttesenSCG-928-A19]
AVAGHAFAEVGAIEADLGDIRVVLDDVTRDGDRFLIEMVAVYEKPGTQYSYMFSLILRPTKGAFWEAEDWIRRLLEEYGVERSVCYIAFRTPEGEPFCDGTRYRTFDAWDWDMEQQDDGTWHRQIKLDAFSVYPDAEGVVVEFYVLTDPDAFDGMPTATMYVPLV